MNWIIDFGKGFIAFVGAGFSVVLGMGLAIAGFDLAVGIQRHFFLLIPCLIVAAIAPLFFILIPRYIYLWRFGFPKIGFKQSLPS
jgi:hypothetical protein